MRELSLRDIQSGVVGNFAAGLFTRQLHLGSMLTEIDESMRGIPTFHAEAACASGSVAVLAAAQQIMGGLHDVVIVAGAEQQKTMSPAQGSDVLGAAGDFDAEKAQFGDFMFPRLFGHIAESYAQKYGLDEKDLARVAVKNRSCPSQPACANPRKYPDPRAGVGRIIGQPAHRTAAQGHRLLADHGRSGGAGLCSDRFIRTLAAARSRPLVKLLGFGHTTDHLALRKKDVPNFAIVRWAARQAYDMSGVGPGDLNGVEVHDCFSISEIIAYEVLGLAEPGAGAQLLRSGATALPSAREILQPTERSTGLVVPVNAGGGLIGDGHPVGAIRGSPGRGGRMSSPGSGRRSRDSRREAIPYV